MAQPRSCFFCGIGGSGMSALAQTLCLRGWDVSGSDRSFDKGEAAEKFSALQALGIRLYPQDGSGIHGRLGMVVYSTAVEDTIPDIRKAKEQNVPLRHRAALLADLFHESPGRIAIAGTSGKSTVTAMAGWILHAAGQEPTIINGARMINFENSGLLGNAVSGRGDFFVIETDESDGSLSRFSPSIGVIANISLDHKPMVELNALFSAFAGRCGQVMANADDANTMKLMATAAIEPAITFGVDNMADFQAKDIMLEAWKSRFTIFDRQRGVSAPVTLNVPGRHNVYNALAACAVAEMAGVPLEKAAEALPGYQGLRRRFELAGIENNITVIDDFAHNPDKIAATLAALHRREGRIIVVYQPHGFGPTKLLKDDLIKTFINALRPDDLLLMPEIYYAGGTATRDISSRDITDGVAAAGRQTRYFEKRSDIIPFLGQEAISGDKIVVMGARDDTLPDFARGILSALKEKDRRLA